MGTRTGIQWTDATWNPMTGCTRISRGCDNCYALLLATTRLRDVYTRRPPARATRDAQDPFAPRFWPERLELPLRWRDPRRIFVDSMSDLFHADFSLSVIQAVFSVMNRASQHQFQILTKRPERAARIAPSLEWTPNIWLGTSVEDMRVAHRVKSLRRVPAAVRFISAEPLLGSLRGLDLTSVHWVIGGGESGPSRRPVDVSWARELRDLCCTSGVAFFWKQWGGHTPKAGGRLLDGREWNEFPHPRR